MKNLILLHGALGSSEDLDALKHQLEQLGHKVYSFTFSGHAGTAYQPVFTIPQFSRELESFITEQALNHATVFGYSMGGFVALHLAASKPGVIDAVITLGTKFDWSKESVEKETKMMDPHLIEEKVPTFAKALESRHGNWKELLARTADLMQDLHQNNFLNDEVLKQIQVPVLLGLGDKDLMVSLEETRHVFKTLPKASMYMLPATKHPIETANAGLLSQVVTSFLNTVSKTAGGKL